MASFLIFAGLISAFLIYLIIESIRYNRLINRIPIRITVSGTRGKSSIVRTLASVLRAHGINVLAKTTGSEAMYILPDGSLEKIRRKGLPSIIEQKKLVFKAIKLQSECLITEIMSIHPDNHQIETHKLIKPGITILANFRADHTDVTEDSPDKIAELFLNDVYPESKVIIPQEELNTFIINGISKIKSNLIIAVKDVSTTIELPLAISQIQIPANLDIVVTTARYLGIPDETIKRGILEARMDIGQLKVFDFHLDNRKIWFVNAFAANDPVSTLQIMAKTREIISNKTGSNTAVIGLLALRSDRGERSRQWLDYLESNRNNPFEKIFVSGIHSAIFTRKLKNCETIRTKSAEKVTHQIIESTQGNILVFGIANIHGLGLNLIEYWENHKNLN